MKTLEDNFSHKTQSLTIRFYQSEDYHKWQKLFSNMDDKQNQWDWEAEKVNSLTVDRFNAKLERHKQERMTGQNFYFCVENKNKDLVGICLITIIHKTTAEIGFQLNNRYWGKGLGLELSQGVTDICKNNLGIAVVRALVNKSNFASIHILEKIGMKSVGENETQWIFETYLYSK